MMWWDQSVDKWVDGTTCEIKLSGREVSWVSNRTGVLCIAQPRTLDLPYKSWSLSPALPAVQDGPSEVEEACAVLSLETPRMTVKSEARGDGSCRLVGPGRPELKPLMTTSMNNASWENLLSCLCGELFQCMEAAIPEHNRIIAQYPHKH